MSPKAAAEFGKQWPALKRRLEAFLRSKGVGPSDMDDLVQETATRLLSVWHKFDRSKPAWPLTATIALNLLRDRGKKQQIELPGELPEVASSFDAAQIGLARIELSRVLRAMEDLTPPQRAALLQTFDETVVASPSTSSEKMLRLRARKRLANAVGRVSAGVCLKLRRAGDLVHAFFAKGDVVQALACAACLLVTTAGATSFYPRFEDATTPPTGARTNFVTAGSRDAGSPAAVTTTYSEDFPVRARSVTAPAGARYALGKTDRGDRSSTSDSNTASPDAADHASVTVVPASLPGNAPVPAPPDAPTEPPQAPAMTEPPSADGGAPVQVPTGDAPIEVLDETTEALGEVTN